VLGLLESEERKKEKGERRKEKGETGNRCRAKKNIQNNLKINLI
jgi:hypothetical protein